MPPKMSRENPGEKIHSARDDEAPTRQKMQAAAPAVLIKRLERSRLRNGRVLSAEELLPAFPSGVAVISADGELDPGGSKTIADIAPIQSRMHHEDFSAGKDQQKKADG